MYGEHSLGSGACSYPDSVTSYRSNIVTAELRAEASSVYFRPLDFFFKKKIKPTLNGTDAALYKHNLATWKLELVSLLLQIHWRLRLKAQVTAAPVGLYGYTLHLPTHSVFYLTDSPVGYLSTEGRIMLCKRFFHWPEA